MVHNKLKQFNHHQAVTLFSSLSLCCTQALLLKSIEKYEFIYDTDLLSLNDFNKL